MIIPADFEGLRRQFLSHMESYEKILSLRAIRKSPNWKYELVEIPLTVLKLANGGELEMKLNSQQFPKPGYCYVRDELGEIIFNVYFDGGGERKLQIKSLRKKHCKVHAEWEFLIPSE